MKNWYLKNHLKIFLTITPFYVIGILLMAIFNTSPIAITTGVFFAAADGIAFTFYSN
jgi:hypothetical protein